MPKKRESESWNLRVEKGEFCSDFTCKLFRENSIQSILALNPLQWNEELSVHTVEITEFYFPKVWKNEDFSAIQNFLRQINLE